MAEEPGELLDHTRMFNYGHHGRIQGDATRKVAELTANARTEVNAQQAQARDL
ncbi:MAG: hypothetical protein ACE5Z5_14740 [Candidatus Bathyarchaeia archaeon]